MRTIKITLLALSVIAGLTFGYLYFFLTPAYHVNAETSEIGDLATHCISEDGWEQVCSKYSIDSIKDPSYLKGLADVKNHFLPPKYILYFPEGPQEILAGDWYTLRVAYNEDIAFHTVHGLSQCLSNEEQVRMRNRVLSALKEHQCSKGKKDTDQEIKKPAPFSESHKNYGAHLCRNRK